MSKESLRSFLEAKANNVTPKLEKILEIPDGVLEKRTSNIPIRTIYVNKQPGNRI